MAVQLSESVHEKRNGSEVRKQTIKKAHTSTSNSPGANTASGALNMLLIISRYVKQSVMDESENGTHTLFVVCIYHTVCLLVVASFEWRIHITAACW